MRPGDAAGVGLVRNGRATQGGLLGAGQEPDGAGWRPPPGSTTWLANARCAIWLALWRHRPHRVVAPVHVCASALEPARRLGIPVVLVEVDDELRAIEPPDLHADDLVHAIDHFGFPTSRALEAAARAAGALLLRDAAMTLVPTGPADLVVLSPRKHLGICDGGVLVDNTRARERAPRPDPAWLAAPRQWRRAARTAVDGRARADCPGSENIDWYAAFREAEATQPLGMVAMSARSRHRIDAVDAESVVERRRSNYRTYQTLLADHSVLGPLPDAVAPSHFLIRVRNRDNVRSALMAQGVYPPIHWPLHDLPGAAEHPASVRRANTLLSLPIDHRLETHDLECTAKLIAARGETALVRTRKILSRDHSADRRIN